jgi:tetratricopeptide (TPR) repeat protein
VDAWRHAVSVHPNAAASRQAAELLDQSLDIHARLTLWQEISSQQPDALLPVLRQTMALLEAGNKNEAQRLCNLLAERYPHDGETMIMNGILSCLCDHKAHPIRLDQIPPDALDAQSAAMAERLSSAAHIARESGQWECALLFLQKACRLDADNLAHPVALGETFFSLRRFEEAAEPFSRVLLAAPESPHSAKLLDEALQQLNDPEKRLQYWRRILEAHPDARIPRQYYEALLN